MTDLEQGLYDTRTVYIKKDPKISEKLSCGCCMDNPSYKMYEKAEDFSQDKHFAIIHQDSPFI